MFIGGADEDFDARIKRGIKCSRDNTLIYRQIPLI